MKEIIQITGPKVMKTQCHQQMIKIVRQIEDQESQTWKQIKCDSFIINRSFGKLEQTTEHFQVLRKKEDKSQYYEQQKRAIYEKLAITEKKKNDYQINKQRTKLFNELFNLQKRMKTVNIENPVFQLRTNELDGGLNGKAEIRVRPGGKEGKLAVGQRKGSEEDIADILQPVQNRYNKGNQPVISVGDVKTYELTVDYFKKSKVLQQYNAKVKEINQAINQTLRHQRLQAYDKSKNLNKEVSKLEQQQEKLQEYNSQAKAKLESVIANKRRILNNMRNKAKRVYQNKIAKAEKQYNKYKQAREAAIEKYNQWNQRKNDMYNHIKELGHQVSTWRRQAQPYVIKSKEDYQEELEASRKKQ